MWEITVEELEKIESNQRIVVDIRPNEQFQRGTFPGAVNIPMDEEEAMLQMELLNHDFFMFKNIDEDCISVLYKRKDGKMYKCIQRKIIRS